MNLTVIENKTISLLPAHYQEYALAKFKKAIREYSDYDLATAIKIMLIRSHAELRITLTEKDDVLTFLRETLMRDLRKPKFSTLSIDLISLFISNGVRGEYPNKNLMNTINIQNIHFWINEGLKSESYKQAIAEFNKKLEEEEIRFAKKPVYYTEAQFKAMAIEAFKEYQKDGTMPPVAGYCALCYDFIKKSNGEETLIDRLDWDEIKELAKRSYSNDMNHGRRKSELLDLDYSISNRSFEFHIKKHGLRFYFDMLIKSGKELQL